MKRVFWRLLSVSLAAVLAVTTGLSAQGAEPPLELSAESAVLLTADTGTVLFEKDSRTQRPMASTTKIMTALLALEEAAHSADPVVEITEEMVDVEGSSMGLKAGDSLTLKNLTAGMMMASGNDAANAVALFLDGSQEAFAQRMNRRASEIGMKDTRFVTPSGLDEEGHGSTAYDMALLAREALKNSAFREIVSSTEWAVEFLGPARHTVNYTNHNKLLEWVDGCIGVKTGYTKKAGRCLVSAAEREGVVLIAVTLSAPDDWEDHETLLEYGFSSVQRVSFDPGGFSLSLSVVGGEHDRLPVQGSGSVSVTVPAEQAGLVTSRVLLPRFVYAPVLAGEALGRVQYYLDGAPLLSLPLLAGESADAVKKDPGFWEQFFSSWEN